MPGRIVNRIDLHVQGEKKGRAGEGGSGPEPGNWHPGIPQVGTSNGWGGGPGWIYNLSSL